VTPGANSEIENMATITNKHSTPLSLQDGTTLPPGVATNVENWDELKDNAVLQAWQNAGILEVSGAEVSTEDEKAALLGRLDELGVRYDKRAGLQKLRDAVAAAEQQKADAAKLDPANPANPANAVNAAAGGDGAGQGGE